MATVDADPIDLRKTFVARGDTHIRYVNGLTCALRGFFFTTALVVGLDNAGYDRCYCYEHADDAQVALAA
ncbi:MAG: hypothetical protein EOP13_14170 [Pseudomonas sp.]|uniref:hypothetical protein n=1 Tax=Pseudomonas sp. TaxID=306 RepID=UPI0012251831|nr:hypothetical protein [Pseudomonas sp.]RZI72725.1 MAG: hypothetical protein EOP13_14170 [Pseudomonas sp.]